MMGQGFRCHAQRFDTDARVRSVQLSASTCWLVRGATANYCPLFFVVLPCTLALSCVMPLFVPCSLGSLVFLFLSGCREPPAKACPRDYRVSGRHDYHNAGPRWCYCRLASAGPRCCGQRSGRSGGLSFLSSVDHETPCEEGGGCDSALAPGTLQDSLMYAACVGYVTWFVHLEGCREGVPGAGVFVDENCRSEMCFVRRISRGIRRFPTATYIYEKACTHSVDVT